MKALFNRNFSHANSFPVFLPGKVLWLCAKEITFLEGDGNYTYIHTCGRKKYLVSKTMKSVEETLDAGFIRVHKSYMINPDHILSRPESDLIELSCGKRIPIARRRIRETHEILCPLMLLRSA